MARTTRVTNQDGTVTFELGPIPAALAGQIDAAFQASYNYSPSVPDPAGSSKTIPNPIAPTDFAGECVINFIAEVVTAYHVQAAQKQATDAAQAAVKSALGVLG